MNITATLSKARRLFPDKECVVDGDRRLTYRQTAERVDRLAAALAAVGMKSQDCISVIAPNSLEFLESYYAGSVLGLIVNPINVRLLGPEMAFILNDAKSRLVIADPRYKDRILEALKEAKFVEGVVWLTDAPPILTKGRSWAYEAFLDKGKADFREPEPLGDDLNDTDVWYHVAPMFHLADAWATFAVTWVGGRHVIQPEFEAGEVLATIEKEGITLTNLIPTMLNLMVNHDQAKKFNYSSLKVILSGGAPIAPETVRRIISTFHCDYVQTYGLTETSPYCTVSTLKAHLKELPIERQREIISRTGREFITVELRVVDEQGRDVPGDDQSVGEIWVRGDTVTPGYLNRPDIVDRKKDIIISGGENVYSTEVEYVLMEHPAVLECVVIGVPDRKWGEAVKAVVVLKPGEEVEEEELKSFVKERLARYKAPKNVDFVDSLPKTGSGKLMKRAVREFYWKGEKRRVH